MKMSCHAEHLIDKFTFKTTETTLGRFIQPGLLKVITSILHNITFLVNKIVFLRVEEQTPNKDFRLVMKIRGHNLLF